MLAGFESNAARAHVDGKHRRDELRVRRYRQRRRAHGRQPVPILVLVLNRDTYAYVVVRE
jgi:hypothetical protein